MGLDEVRRADAASGMASRGPLSPLRETVAALRLLRRKSRRLKQSGSPKAARMLMLRASFRPRLFLDWMRFMETFHAAIGVTRVPASTLQKPLRSYVTRSWSAAERVERLKQHYRILQATLSQDCLLRTLSQDGVELGRLGGKQRSYRLTLSAAHATRQEGELSLQLYDEAGTLCGRLTFMFCGDALRGRALVIGGLQGPPAAVDKRLIITATRDMYGMRPKQCLLEAAQYLAGAFACSAILAVSNGRHVVRGLGLRRVGHKFKADYDAFLAERSGFLDSSGMFLLPVFRPHEADATGPGKYKIKREIADGIRAFRDSCRPGSP